MAHSFFLTHGFHASTIKKGTGILRNQRTDTAYRSASMSDPFNLQRFVDAQADVIDRVFDELRAGRKRSHWMWFVFPQLAGLGHSAMAERYAIASLEEARAYLAHPLLSTRLADCSA